MKKIQLILIVPFLLSCSQIADAFEDDEADVDEYSMGKPTSYVRQIPDGNTTIHEFKWVGNNLSRYADNVLLYEAKFNDYGRLLERQHYNSDGLKGQRLVWEASKWRVLSYEIYNSSGNLVRKDSVEWSKDSLETKHYDALNNVGQLIFMETYDETSRRLSAVTYDSDGNIRYEYSWKWDTSSRWRGLEKVTNGNVEYQIEWDGYNNNFTRYNPDGSIIYTSTREVNEFDDALVTTYKSESQPDYNGRIEIYTWKSERFKPYYTK
tara:strand:+ start:62 stop:856 length:795 start_codon:yes stop_codon:yes gene_type:complete